MKNRIAITGIGVLSPAGISKDVFWKNCQSGKSFVSEITKFDASKYPSHIAGEIDNYSECSNVSPRLAKKMDNFSHMALVASDQALKDSKISLDDIDKNRVGVFMGNALGGWFFAETELRDMYVEGREGISPYMVSSWFPAAPQGQISIYYGLKGYSKTFVSDRASSALAIWHGAKTLKDNKNDFVLAGGTEAPITPYSLLCVNTCGLLTQNNANPEKAYRPFDKNRDGFALAEAAGMVGLEREADAIKRGAHIYGFIKGFGFSSDGVHHTNSSDKSDELEYAITECLKDASWEKADVDYICLDAEGSQKGDRRETAAIKNVFNKYLDSIALSAPKSMYGNALGAQSVLDLITTLFTLESNIILPTINIETTDSNCDLNYTPNVPVKKCVKRALIIACGRGGINFVLAIEK